MHRRVVAGIATAALVASASFVVAERTETSDGASPPAFDAALVARGAALSAIGNCRPCHTAEGGKAFAGGRSLQTPFGTLHSTNITPEPETGIGRWTAAEFRRAMHEGIDREGRHLYPAFPYDHFTRVTDGDVAALYAFVMTREPVRARPPDNRLMFPANLRGVLAGWKSLYFVPGRFRDDPSRSADWNRGAYLVEGLAHCGACHTPRNAAGAERTREALAGGEVENWHAPALGAASVAPVPWTAEALVRYLREGFDRQHGVAAGPMAPVVDGLATVPESEVRAMAIYLTDLQARRAPPDGRDALQAARLRELDAPGSYGARSVQAGEAIFAGACATCHSANQDPDGPVPLELTASINAPDPRNALHIVLDGLQPAFPERGIVMPGFRGALTEAQVVALVQYLRARFSREPRWNDILETLRMLAPRGAR